MKLINSKTLRNFCWGGVDADPVPLGTIVWVDNGCYKGRLDTHDVIINSHAVAAAGHTDMIQFADGLVFTIACPEAVPGF